MWGSGRRPGDRTGYGGRGTGPGDAASLAAVHPSTVAFRRTNVSGPTRTPVSAHGAVKGPERSQPRHILIHTVVARRVGARRTAHAQPLQPNIMHTKIMPHMARCISSRALAARHLCTELLEASAGGDRAKVGSLSSARAAHARPPAVAQAPRAAPQ